MEGGASIVIELLPELAPNTVNSFIHLAKLGCFDGHAIQRIVPGYVADMSYSAFGKDYAKYLIPNESRNNGFAQNTMTVQPGVVAMGGYRDGIAGGEFFFPYALSERIDGNYPGFGTVLEGWDEVERWATVELVPVHYEPYPDMKVNRPATPIVIKRVTVETFGREFPPPVTTPIHKMPPSW